MSLQLWTALPQLGKGDLVSEQLPCLWHDSLMLLELDHQHHHHQQGHPTVGSAAELPCPALLRSCPALLPSCPALLHYCPALQCHQEHFTLLVCDFAFLVTYMHS